MGKLTLAIVFGCGGECETVCAGVRAREMCALSACASVHVCLQTPLPCPSFSFAYFGQSTVKRPNNFFPHLLNTANRKKTRTRVQGPAPCSQTPTAWEVGTVNLPHR